MKNNTVTITVVGGKGRMGAMLCELWDRDHAVHAVDREWDAGGAFALSPRDLERVVPGSRVVALAVPAPAMPEVMALLRPHLHARHILTDVCSVKTRPMQWMQEIFPGPVVGAHPFFGPENDREKRRAALVRGTKATDDDCALVEGLFRQMGCETFFTTAEEHDRAVGVSQSLHFALAAAYFTLVSRHEGLAPYLTPSFTRHMEAARKELTVNAPMFCEFTENNPVFPEVLADLRRLLEKAGDGGLRRLAAEAGAWYTHCRS